mgnify:CR=1 FL=1
MEKQLPQPGWRYRHFKGGLYQIVTLALNTETGEDMVVYQALYDDFKVYVRPLSMFLSETDFVKYPDSTQPMRFERIDAEDDRNVPKPLETTSCEPSFEETTEELPDGISPKLIAFLDADSDEERYTILNERIHCRDKELKEILSNGCKYGKGIRWRRFSCERSGIRCYYRKKRIREKYTFAYAGWTGCANRRGSVGRG